MNIPEPTHDDAVVRMVESHRQHSGQPYPAILMFGLAGSADCSPEIRRYAGYRHTADHPHDGPVWLELARLHAEDGEFDAAHAILDALDHHGAPGLYPEIYSEDTTVHRAHFWADAGRWSEALALLDDLDGRHADGVVYRYVRASVLHAMERFDAAVEGYDEALAALTEYAEEDEDDGETELAAVASFLQTVRDDAEAERPFDAPRPFMLSALRDDDYAPL